MTDSDRLAGTWKPLPGAGDYEASHRGHVRSLDRTKNGRFYKGIVLKLREDPDGYLRVNITNDRGERKYNESVARLVLMAHDLDSYQEGMHACHGPGGTRDNRWPENIRWDTPEANREEALEVLRARLASRPPKPPKQLPQCVNFDRCGNFAGRGGRRCHPCVEEVGRAGAAMLADGVDLAKAAESLDYASEVGLYRLAVKYGGGQFVITGNGHAPSSQPRLRRVLFRRGSSRQDSDAQ